MAIIIVIARIVLALTFGVAGVAKLLDRAGTARSLRGFGVPVVAATPLAVVLPLAELVVAAALLVPATAWLGAIGALLLFSLFEAAIVANLVLHRRPACNCFGRLHSAPVGASTLVRNLALAVLAGVVVAAGQVTTSESAALALGELAEAPALTALGVVVLLLVVVGEGWLLWNLIQQNGRLLLRIENLERRLGPD